MTGWSRSRPPATKTRCSIVGARSGMTLAMLDGVLAARPLSQKIVLVLLGVALFLGIAGWNAHTARKLQKEIDAFEIE